MNRKTIKYIPVILLSVVIISGLSFSTPLFADDVSITITDTVALGPLDAGNYDIKEDSLKGILTSSEKGTVEVNYTDSAELKVSMTSEVPTWLSGSDLQIKLGDKDWQTLGNNTVSLSLEGKKEIDYELKYDVSNQSSVPSPGTYLIGLKFSLSQTGGCYGPVIEIASNELGPDELLKLKLTSSCGPVKNADVDSSNKDDYTKPNGKANLGQQPSGDIDVAVKGDGLDNLNGDLDFSFDGDNLWGDLRVYVSGKIGPGRTARLRVEDQNGDPVEGVTVTNGDTTDSNGELTFKFPDLKDFDLTLYVEPNGQNATLKFDYDFDPYEV